MQLRFGDYSLDAARRELKHRDALVSVEPQVFDLLLYLVHNRDRVVSKDDVLEAVWSGRVVSESTLTSRINAARRAIGDSGAQQEMIRTVARKGFRFVAPVTEPGQEAGTGDSRAQAGPAGDSLAPGDPVLHTAGDGTRIAYASVGDGAAAGQGRQLAQSPRVRLGKPDLEALPHGDGRGP